MFSISAWKMHSDTLSFNESPVYMNSIHLTTDAQKWPCQVRRVLCFCGQKSPGAFPEAEAAAGAEIPFVGFACSRRCREPHSDG